MFPSIKLGKEAPDTTLKLRGATAPGSTWRANWTPERVSRTATHKSGVTARVSASPTDPRKDRIMLENTAALDLTRWNLGALTEQAVKLWIEGAF